MLFNLKGKSAGEPKSDARTVSLNCFTLFGVGVVFQAYYTERRVPDAWMDRHHGSFRRRY